MEAIEENGENEAPTTRWGRVVAFVRAHRRRLSMVALALFLAAVGVEIGGVYPREVRVAVPLGGRADEVTEARIRYSQEGEAVKTVRVPVRGDTRELRDTVELSPGEYEVTVMLLEDDGELRELSGRLTAPADGVVRLALEDR
jgi:hypothetical protein